MTTLAVNVTVPVSIEPTREVTVIHSRDCKSKNTKCNCPKQLYIARDRRRISAKTRSWTRAEDEAQKIRDSFDPLKRELAALRKEQDKKNSRKEVTLEDAFKQWMEDAVSNGSQPETMDGSKTLKKQITEFMATKGVSYVAKVDTSLLTQWKATWKERKTSAKGKKRGQAIRFFDFCVGQGWLDENPAKGLTEPIGEDSLPTLPLPRELYDAIIDATYIYDNSLRNRNKVANSPLGTRLRVFIQTMRWSGLAIRDTALLARDRLRDDNVLELRRAKTGTPVTVPLPAVIAEELREVPAGRATAPEFFFWSGKGKPRGQCGLWNRAFQRLWKLVPQEKLDRLRDRTGKVVKPHPHMLRDTFAVEFLRARTGDIRDLQILLGHTSIKTTEKHYLALVPQVVEDLERVVRDSWAAQGAPGVQGTIIAPRLHAPKVQEEIIARQLRGQPRLNASSN